MKKWLRRTLIAALLVGLTLAALYEAATHVGRGWLRGEAFYEGRPTSYWRCKIDEWMDRFDSVDDAVRSIDDSPIGPKQGAMFSIIEVDANGMLDLRNMPPSPKAKKQSWITKMLDLILTDEEGLRDLPPKVLWGWRGSKQMLTELAATDKYRLLVERCQMNVRSRTINTAPREGEVTWDISTWPDPSP